MDSLDEENRLITNLEEELNIVHQEIRDSIEDKQVVFDYASYQAQFWDISVLEDQIYYVVRIAYIDQSNRDYTTTIARYWVRVEDFRVLREDLMSGQLFEE